MNENIKWGAAAVAVVGLSIGAVVYFSRNDKAPPPMKPAALAPADAPEVAAAEPAIKHPIPQAQTAEPLPPLNDSDVPIQNALAGLIGVDSVQKFIVPEDLARHIVVAVDNLTTEKVPERIRPMKRVPGSFAVTGSEDALVLDPANYERYKGVVQILNTMDTQQLVAAYTRYYPLFQEAYESLGHPPEYFNDRLIEVIDHLLETPDLQGPVALAQPNVQYEYADTNLESRSAGQKALMRLGPENAAAVKSKLKELRAALVARKP